ncbi:MAG: hypothetical protein GXZ14_00870 [Ruminococcaceae bacterium]|nr:hypothetical protein [Oscillospiraceae bacterium]
MNINYPVECPLMGKKIDMDTCFDIHMVVCGDAPKWTAPAEIYATADYVGVCNACQYHRDD